MGAMTTRHHSAPAAALPARDLVSVQLAERFGPPGCPMCRHRRAAVTRYIEGFLVESVNDVAFRAALDTARGFCPTHVRAVSAVDRGLSGGMLGSAILLDAIMRVRIDELAGVHAGRGIGRGRRARAAAAPAGCMVCATAIELDTVTASSLVRLSADDAWSEALGSAELCLEHLARMMAVADRPVGWAAVERRQLARLRAIRDLVVAYAHHASHDRRHLTTPEEIEAPARAVDLLAGDPA